MEIKLEKVKLNDKDRLSNLLDEYLEELFEKDKKELGPYKYLDNYFIEPNRHPFFILTDGKIVGFALINLNDPLSDDIKHAISEFYIFPKYRNKGIGEKAVKQIFDIFLGDWAIRVLKKNPAIRFWRKVIKEYTDGKYDEFEQSDEKWNGIVLSFKNLNI